MNQPIYEWAHPDNYAGSEILAYCAPDHILAERIQLGFEVRGWEVQVSKSKKGRIVIKCQVTPNTLFSMGIGGGLPVAWRLTQGHHHDADSYFVEEFRALFDSFHSYMNRRAWQDGATDRLRTKAEYKTRWKGTQWEEYYEKGRS